MRFLLSRRWVLFFLVVVLLAWGAAELGQWQFHRLHDRKHSNRVTATNLEAPPVPLADVLSRDRAARAGDEWRRVTVHGQWDDKHSVVLKYQTRDSGPGVDVVTPLVTSDGSAVLVDRGWIPTANSGASRPKLPPVADGTVTVTGYVRVDATGAATRVSALSTRAISSRTVAPALPYPLYRGFLDLAQESPPAPKRLGAVELPDDTSNGPHFFYGLQWWFFGALAIFGFFFLAWDEFRRRRAGQPQSDAETGSDAEPGPMGGEEPSERPQHAAVHGQHGAAHEG